MFTWIKKILWIYIIYIYIIWIILYSNIVNFWNRRNSLVFRIFFPCLKSSKWIWVSLFFYFLEKSNFWITFKKINFFRKWQSENVWSCVELFLFSELCFHVSSHKNRSVFLQMEKRIREWSKPWAPLSVSSAFDKHLNFNSSHKIAQAAWQETWSSSNQDFTFVTLAVRKMSIQNIWLI